MNEPPDYQVCIDEEQDFLDDVNMRTFYQEFCFGGAECRIDPDIVYAANMELGFQKEQEKASSQISEQNVIERLYIPTKKGKKRPGRKNKNKSSSATNTPKKDENRSEVQNEMTGEQMTKTNHSNATEGSITEDNTSVVLQENISTEDKKGLEKDQIKTDIRVINSNTQDSKHSTIGKSKTPDVHNTPKKQGKKSHECKANAKAGITKEKSRLSVKDMPEIYVDDLEECYTEGLSCQRKGGKGVHAQDRTRKEKLKQEECKIEARCASGDSQVDESTDTILMLELIHGFRDIKQKWRVAEDEAEKKKRHTSCHSTAKETLKVLTKCQCKPEAKTIGTFYENLRKHDCRRKTKGNHMPVTASSSPCNQLFTFGSTEHNTTVQKPKPKIVKPILKKTERKTERESNCSQMNMDNSHPTSSSQLTLDKQNIPPSTPESDSRVKLYETKSKSTIDEKIEKRTKLSETKKPKISDPKINGTSKGDIQKSKEVKIPIREGKHMNTYTRTTNTTSTAISAIEKSKQKIGSPFAVGVQKARVKLIEVKPAPIKKENFVKNNEVKSPLKEAKNIKVTIGTSKSICSTKLTAETGKQELPTVTAETKSTVSETKTTFNKTAAIENILKKNPFSINNKTNLKGCPENTPVSNADRTPRKPFMKAITKQKTCKETEKSSPDKSKASKIPIPENLFKIGDTCQLSTASQMTKLDQQNCTQNEGLSEMKCTETSKHGKNNEESKTGFWKRVGHFFKAKK